MKNKSLCSLALWTMSIGMLSTITTHAGEDRSDFQGIWRNQQGQLFDIVQYGKDTAIVTDKTFNISYDVSFSNKEPSFLPTAYFNTWKHRRVNDQEVDFLQSASYQSKLSVEKDYSKASFTFNAAIGISDPKDKFSGYTFEASAKASAFVNKKTDKYTRCSADIEARHLTVKLSGLKINKITSKHSKKSLKERVVNYLAERGILAVPESLSYSETLTEVSPRDLPENWDYCSRLENAQIPAEDKKVAPNNIVQDDLGDATANQKK